MNGRAGTGYTPADWGLAVIRVVVGVVFLMHGWQKLSGGIGGVEQFFSSLSVPAPGLMAPLVTFVEIIGGIALIAGVLTRLAALLLVVDMLVALFIFHLPNGFFVSPNGGYELVLLLAAACLGLALAGPGALAIDNLLGDSVLGRFGGAPRQRSV